MNNSIVDSKVHLLRAGESTSEFEILGVSIIAHLLAIPRLFSRKDLVELPGSTIQWFGHLYRHPGKMSGYQQAWIGKAFEYAVAELFNNRSEPYWSLICGGIDAALSTRVSPRVNQVSLDIERLSCVRVSRECADAEDLKREFGRFRILRDARRSIDNAARTFPGLETKVDVLFCERETEEFRRFAVMASLKVNREEFLKDDVHQDFHSFPIDLGISIETAKYRGVIFDPGVGAYVAYLPMNVKLGIYAWKNASRIVGIALAEGQKNKLIQFFQGLFRPGTPENYWVEFLAKRLQVDIKDVAQEIRRTLRRAPRERITTVPVLLGAREDAVLDLGVQ
jgi:hypothetical protein